MQMSEETPVAKPQLDKKEEPELDRKEAEEPAAKKTKLHARGPPPLPQEVFEDTQPQPAAQARRAAERKDYLEQRLLTVGLPADELEELLGTRPPRPVDKDGGGPPPLHHAEKRGGSGHAEQALKEKALTEKTLKEKAKQKR